MAQDTASSKAKKNDEETKLGRWFRYVPKQPELPELDHVFDFYWGGSERRITGLTLKIISVNAIALIMLVIGIIYLGQYQNNIIETKVESFAREVTLISYVISQSDLEDENTHIIIENMMREHNQTLKIYNKNREQVFNKRFENIASNNTAALQSVQILKNTASFMISLLPDNKQIPQYPIDNTPDLAQALGGNTSLSVWQDDDEEILLSAGLPLTQDNQNEGAIIILREGGDIKDAIGETWKDILRIFSFTLLITVIISIYLSGTIANPLKKLAKAAEKVRSGQIKGEDIPDLSDRYDEIGDLSLVLRDMTQALWEKMDSIESFAADVAHELKNPLTSLKSAIETLHKVSKKEDRAKLLDIIDHDIERMDRLITDISAASRLDSEMSRESFKHLDIKNTITLLLEDYKNPMERDTQSKNNQFTTQDGIAITFDYDTSTPHVIFGSDNRLKHVLRNLIDNAISFSQDKDTVLIRLQKKHNNIIINVEDSGPGIPESKLKTIFDRFYTERPDHDYGQNSGLGLSICKQIIETHRGKIFAENIYDNKKQISGARFTVMLQSSGTML